MTDFILSPAAQKDVDNTWDYIASEWGEQQAVHYTTSIRNLCRALAQGRLRGRPVDIRKGCFKAVAGSHVLYFQRRDDGAIIVVRILH